MTTRSRSSQFSSGSLPSWSRKERDSYWSRTRPLSSPHQYPRLEEVQVLWGLRLRSLPMTQGASLGSRYGSWLRRESQREGREGNRVDHSIPLNVKNASASTDHENPDESTSISSLSGSKRGGQLRLHLSERFVASRRLKRGDPVAVSWKLTDGKDCQKWREYTAQHRDLFAKASSSGRLPVPRSGEKGHKNHSQHVWRDYASYPGKGKKGCVHRGIPLGNPRNFPQLREYYDLYRPLGTPSQRTRNLIWSGVSGDSRKDSQLRMGAILSLTC